MLTSFLHVGSFAYNFENRRKHFFFFFVEFYLTVTDSTYNIK